MLSEKKANYFMVGGGIIIFFVFAVIMVFMTIGHNKRKNYEELHDKYLTVLEIAPQVQELVGRPF